MGVCIYMCAYTYKHTRKIQISRVFLGGLGSVEGLFLEKVVMQPFQWVLLAVGGVL